MAEETTTDSKSYVERLDTQEVGFSGLRISNGLIYEEIKTDLVFPRSITTFKQMAYDATIASAMSYYEIMMLKAKRQVTPVEGATQAELEQAKHIRECLDDMDHSWQDFMQEVSSMNTYGFATHEIVLRKRKHSKGSKFNDGKVGIARLPMRAQDTIKKWVYTEDERTLLGLEQHSNLTQNGGLRNEASNDGFLPRHKFLLFRTGKRKDNPFGESLLKNCFFAWRYKLLIEEQEAIGVQRDLSGVPHAEVPPQIMSEDATPSEKAQYEMWKRIVRNIHSNQQSGLVTPLMYDPETKQPLYKFSLMKNEGGKAYDTTKIKEYYQNAILTALHADILILGQGASGSYALGSIKGSMTAISIESRLSEIANVFNHHLIPLIADRNGWDLTRLPELSFGDIEAVDIELVSKAFQRLASVGLLELDREVLNKARELIGVDPLASDAPIDKENLTMAESKSGDGMEKGSGNGTSDNAATTDTSSDNLENAG